MPKPPVPQELQETLSRPNPAVIGTLKPDGSPHTVATWYLWEDGRVLVNMAGSRRRLEYVRRDPRVSLTVLEEGNWYHHVSLRGRVVSIEPDDDLSGIDRLSRHYTGQPYSNRGDERWNAWIEVDTWHAWNVNEPWEASAAAA
jgi:PPOX class probable F420-dependent enzyme